MFLLPKKVLLRAVVVATLDIAVIADGISTAGVGVIHLLLNLLPKQMLMKKKFPN
jgi:hypothetical protein